MSGYAPFSYDVTDFLNYGTKNVLVVRVDATQGEGWFYEGAGIYRHVWLAKTHPVHVAQWGTYVSCEARQEPATVSITTELENETDSEQACRVLSTIVDSTGKVVGGPASVSASIPARSQSEVKQQIVVDNPCPLVD
jgi:beta-galactosidase